MTGTDGDSTDRLLSLEHISAAGRRDLGALDGSCLVSFERHRNRIQATFAPHAAAGLSVRAAWEPTPSHEGFDLEVQVSATGRRVFRRLEVAVASRWAEGGESASTDTDYRVEPRDVSSAASSYDGREPRELLSRLTTMPVPATPPGRLSPLIRRWSGPEARPSYVEMVRPEDCARRMIGEPARPSGDAPGIVTIRYGLLGHDLEKGVVLRARIRGIWVDTTASDDEIRRHLESFLCEPPALGP